MTLKYKLNKNIFARNAVQLNQALELLPAYVLIRFEDKNINGKSLIGLLSAGLQENDTITISYSDEITISQLESILNQFGIKCA